MLGLAALAVVVAVVLIIVFSGGSSKQAEHAGEHHAADDYGHSRDHRNKHGRFHHLDDRHQGGQPDQPDASRQLEQGGRDRRGPSAGHDQGIAIVAQGVPPNTKHDAYAVWLYNSSADAVLLGFVNPGVGSNGRLSTAGALPSNAARFKDLVVTLETQAKPKQPGKIVLQGQLTGLS